MTEKRLFYLIIFFLTWSFSVKGQEIFLNEPQAFCINSKAQVNLSWTSNISGKPDYFILKTPLGQATSTIGPTSSLSYLDKEVISDKSYFYQIKAQKGQSFYFSNVVEVLPLYCPAEFLSAPEPLCQDDGPHVNLKWNLASGQVLYYEVYRNGEKIAQTSNSYFDDNQNFGLQGKEIYRYFIKTIWQNKEKDSMSFEIETPACPPKLNIKSECNLETPGGPKINLFWNNLLGVREYKIYRKTQWDSSFSLLKTLEQTNYSDYLVESLSNNYYKAGKISYYVEAIFEKEDQKASNLIQIDILRCPPYLNAKSVCNSSKLLNPEIHLSWTRTLRATHYNVYRDNQFLYQTTNSDYIDYLSQDNCPEKKCSHNYKIDAVLVGGVLLSSNLVLKEIDCSVIEPPWPPPEIKELRSFCVEGQSRIYLSWTPSNNITYYKIYRNGREVAERINTDFEEQAESGYSYTYYIVAFGIGGLSTVSLNYETIVALNCERPLPSQLSSQTGCDKGRAFVNLSWTETNNTLSYEIWRGNSVNNFSLLTVFDKNSPEYYSRNWTDSNVSTSTTYYYKVVSKGPLGVLSTDSNIISLVTLSCLPNVPSLRIEPNCQSNNPIMNLSWSDSGLNTFYYEIFRQDYEGGTRPYQIISDPRITNWKDINVLSETNYSYKIDAIGFLGSRVSEGWKQSRSLNCSNPEFFTLEEPNIYCQGSYPRVDLVWNNSLNANYYNLYRLINNNFIFYNLTSTSYKDRGLGSTLIFDGVDDYVNIPNSSSLQLTGNLTISFWAYPTDVSKGRQNPLGKAYGGEFDLTMETNGSLSYYHGSAGGNSSPYMSCSALNMFSNNTWVHITIVRDINSRTIRFYKNGILQNSSCGSWVNPSASTRALRIGYEYAGYFAGIIDEIRIYNIALDLNSVKNLYEGNFSGFSSNLVGHWTFDEGQGQIISDSSNFGNYGTRGDTQNIESKDPSWRENGPQWQKDYRWQVQAIGFGGSTFSNQTNIYQMPNCQPTKPGLILNAFCESGLPRVRIRWSFTTQTTKYEIYRQDKGLIKIININDLDFSSRQWTDTNDGRGLSEQTNYTYYVKAIGFLGLENQSDSISILTPSCERPLPPENITATFVCCSLSTGGICGATSTYFYPRINLNWSASQRANSYYIYKRTENGNYSLLGYTDSTNYSDSYPSVAVNTQYSYYLVALGAGGESVSSTPVSIKSGYCSPSQPSIISLIPNCENQKPVIQINWSDPTPFNVLKYEIYRNTNNNIPELPLKTISSSEPEFSDRVWKDNINLNTRTQYYYWLKAIGPTGENISSHQTIVSLNCGAAIDSPQLNLNNQCENNYPIANLSWNSVANALSYNIYRTNPDNSQSIYSTRSTKRNFFVDRGNFALKFDGVDDYVKLSKSLTLTDFSIEFWANIGEKRTDWRTFLGDSGSGWRFSLENNNYYINAHTQGQLRSTFQLTPGQWYHIVLTRDYQGTKLYINGVLNNSNANTNTISNITFQIGRLSTSQYYQGLIDEVRIYGRALDAQEVREHYNGTYRNETELKGVWHFDENLANIVYDDSLSENDGTLYNGVAREKSSLTWPQPLQIFPLENSKDYKYRVKAFGPDTESDFSNEISFNLSCLPKKPNLKVTPYCYLGESRIRLEWNEDPNTSQWNIYKKRENESFRYLTTLDSSKKEYIDRNIETGINYEYYLTAIGLNPLFTTTSDAVATTSLFCYAGVPKPEITNATSVCFGYNVHNKIEWRKDNTGQTIYYNIWRKEKEAQEFEKIYEKLPAAQNFYFDGIDVEEGKTYIYKIEAVGMGSDNSEISEPSQEVQALECSKRAPYPFSLYLNFVEAKDHFFAISIGWTDAGNEEKYIVFRKLASEENFAKNESSLFKKILNFIFGKESLADYENPLTELEADILNFVDYSTSEDTTYSYQIMAVNKNGATLSNVIDVYVPIARPGDFTLFGSRESDNKVNLYWTEALTSPKGGTVYYTVYRSYSQDFSLADKVCENITDLSCIDNNAPFINLYYKVIAKNNGGETESNTIRIMLRIPKWTEVAP